MAINWRQEADKIINTDAILGDIDFILESDINEKGDSEIPRVLGGIDISRLTKETHIQAFLNFFQTKTGRAFIEQFANPKSVINYRMDNKFYSIKFHSFGSYCEHTLRFSNINSAGDGQTSIYYREHLKEIEVVRTTKRLDMDNGIIIQIGLPEALGELSATSAIMHEAFVHAKKMLSYLYTINTNIYLLQNLYTYSTIDNHTALGKGEVSEYKTCAIEMDELKIPELRNFVAPMLTTYERDVLSHKPKE